MQTLDHLIVRLRSRPNPPNHVPTWVDRTLDRGLLPVYSDWEFYYALTSEGAPVSSPDETWAVAAPLRGTERNAVLAQAAERFPDLAFLRPVRGEHDPQCPFCKGAGGFSIEASQIGTSGRVTCSCGGLGWVPGDTAT